jgi:hypothetical protein
MELPQDSQLGTVDISPAQVNLGDLYTHLRPNFLVLTSQFLELSQSGILMGIDWF